MSVLETRNIDKGLRIPIYIQLKDIIKECIDADEFKASERIPSENELAQRFRISRLTVRQAIRELLNEDYLYIVRGEGTFVNKKPAQVLIKLEGFSREMSKLGITVKSKILEIKIVNKYSAYEKAYRNLKVDKNGKLIMVKRLRMLGDTPYALEKSFLPYGVGKNLLDIASEPGFSIYNYLEHELGIELNKAEHIIQPKIPNREIAELLRVKTSEAVLVIEGTTFSAENKPIEYLEGVYIGDKYQLKLKIAK